MRYRSRFNAAGGIADFWSEWKKPTPHRWPILGASLLMTGIVLGWLTQEVYYYPPQQPEVTYITTFAEGRSDEEIRQSNIENQRLKDEREAEEQRRLELRRDLYRAVGAASGLDVEEMEAEIRADEAAEAEAERQRLEEMFGETSGTQTDSE
ncbi:hypothetical protein [Qipengyuania sphaerica]|uniref:hypothetical protein n=1 Tax=Qipengyuania sphaerica TaxID=2867243 RepID=UPI001C875560|nr:hypothetical protein [Qipengyuania sphaerica]MBX7541269.1 hypothetical protein [Qipengyuania sphaerica]